jgi:heme/copper-type cytochrome/quinol oxidase subunit 2
MDIKDITILTFVGCSILIIGLFGFLKTQIQLFRLRQREMGLRQCMGAQQEQLFSLMMWEVAIVFFFVTLIVLGLTSLLAEYAVPIIENVTDGIRVDMSHTYATELWICLITFLVTTGIAALSVRRVITMPLSDVVGKSHRVSTKGRSLLIVSQMVICQLLIFILVSFFYFSDIMGDVYDRKPANQDALRRCIVTNNSIWKPEFKDSIPYLKHVSGSTHVAQAHFRQDRSRMPLS